MNDLDGAAAPISTTADGQHPWGSATPPQTLALARAAQRQLTDLARQADQTRGRVLEIFSAIEAHRQAGIPTTFDVAVELDDTSDRLLDLMGRIHSSCDPYTAWAAARPCEEPAAQQAISIASGVARLEVHGPDDIEHFAVVNSSTDAVIGVDLQGKIVSWNAAAERLYGWSRAEAVGRTIDLIASEESAEVVVARCADLLNGRTVDPFVDERLTRDGRVVEVLITPTAVFTADGTVVAGVAVHRPCRRQSDPPAAA